MKYNGILELKCKIHNQFYIFLKSEYLRKSLKDYDYDYNNIPIKYRKIMYTWYKLGIGQQSFYEYSVSEDMYFLVTIKKPLVGHYGILCDDLLDFVEQIILEISSEIIHCKITEEGPYGWKRCYTDNELRSNGKYSITDDIYTIEHIRNGDGYVVSTTILYNKPIKNVLDITRYLGMSD